MPIKNKVEIERILKDAEEFHKNKKYDQAIALYNDILKKEPGNISARYFFALSQYEKGGYAEAEEAFLQVLKRIPSFADAYFYLAQIAQRQGNIQKAIDCLEASRRVLQKESPRILLLLANLYQEHGDFENALDCAKRMLQLTPDNKDALMCKGMCLVELKRFEEGIACLQRVIQKDPACVQGYINLGTAYVRKDEDFENAIACFTKALTLEPGNMLARANRASACAQVGFFDQCLADFDVYLEKFHSDAYREAIYLHSLHFVQDMSQEAILDKIKRWNQRHALPYASTRPIVLRNPRTLDRPLRIAMLCNSFYRHPAGYMSLPLVENLDQENFPLYLYSDDRLGKDDEFTPRFQNAAKVWRDVKEMSHQQLCDQIRADQIDILIEMIGHAQGGGRFPVIAMRAAPVQVKWAGGLFDTTGVVNMDWLLSDHVETPPGFEKWYTERIYRMPDDYVCLEITPDLPEPDPLPALRNGYVTFGTLNNVNKTNDFTIGLWSEVLKRVPGSKIFLGAEALKFKTVHELLLGRFRNHGIEADRLILHRGGQKHQDFMIQNLQLDIALDPHPFTGGVTTCESLWMGVPVVTLAGTHFASRHAAAHVSSVGLADWVQNTPQDYVDWAVKWANDLSALAKLRAGLRAQVAASPLVDGPRFARNFEQAMCHMWADYCAR
ncbi:MAG: tetratricopeptide repeat protein [Alphaproteobacteria bacterium]|nr:tetratricopeptide repeat protein [Alphaproteobacteria bacterium]